MTAKGAAAGWGDAGAGAGALADEILVDADIAGAFEGRQMAAEIAVGGADQSLEAATRPPILSLVKREWTDAVR